MPPIQRLITPEEVAGLLGMAKEFVYTPAGRTLWGGQGRSQWGAEQGYGTLRVGAGELYNAFLDRLMTPEPRNPLAGLKAMLPPQLAGESMGWDWLKRAVLQGLDEGRVMAEVAMDRDHGPYPPEGRTRVTGIGDPWVPEWVYQMGAMNPIVSAAHGERTMDARRVNDWLYRQPVDFDNGPITWAQQNAEFQYGEEDPRFSPATQRQRFGDRLISDLDPLPPSLMGFTGHIPPVGYGNRAMLFGLHPAGYEVAGIDKRVLASLHHASEANPEMGRLPGTLMPGGPSVDDYIMAMLELQDQLVNRYPSEAATQLGLPFLSGSIFGQNLTAHRPERVASKMHLQIPGLPSPQQRLALQMYMDFMQRMAMQNPQDAFGMSMELPSISRAAVREMGGDDENPYFSLQQDRQRQWKGFDSAHDAAIIGNRPMQEFAFADTEGSRLPGWTHLPSDVANRMSDEELAGAHPEGNPLEWLMQVAESVEKGESRKKNIPDILRNLWQDEEGSLPLDEGPLGWLMSKLKLRGRPGAAEDVNVQDVRVGGRTFRPTRLPSGKWRMQERAAIGPLGFVGGEHDSMQEAIQALTPEVASGTRTITPEQEAIAKNAGLPKRVKSTSKWEIREFKDRGRPRYALYLRESDEQDKKGRYRLKHSGEFGLEDNARKAADKHERDLAKAATAGAAATTEQKAKPSKGRQPVETKTVNIVKDGTKIGEAVITKYSDDTADAKVAIQGWDEKTVSGPLTNVLDGIRKMKEAWKAPKAEVTTSIPDIIGESEKVVEPVTNPVEPVVAGTKTVATTTQKPPTAPPKATPTNGAAKQSVMVGGVEVGKVAVLPNGKWTWKHADGTRGPNTFPNAGLAKGALLLHNKKANKPVAPTKGTATPSVKTPVAPGVPTLELAKEHYEGKKGLQAQAPSAPKGTTMVSYGSNWVVHLESPEGWWFLENTPNKTVVLHKLDGEGVKPGEYRTIGDAMQAAQGNKVAPVKAGGGTVKQSGHEVAYLAQNYGTKAHKAADVDAELYKKLSDKYDSGFGFKMRVIPMTDGSYYWKLYRKSGPTIEDPKNLIASGHGRNSDVVVEAQELMARLERYVRDELPRLGANAKPIRGTKAYVTQDEWSRLSINKALGAIKNRAGSFELRRRMIQLPNLDVREVGFKHTLRGGIWLKKTDQGWEIGIKGIDDPLFKNQNGKEAYGKAFRLIGDSSVPWEDIGRAGNLPDALKSIAAMDDEYATRALQNVLNAQYPGYFNLFGEEPDMEGFVQRDPKKLAAVRSIVAGLRRELKSDIIEEMKQGKMDWREWFSKFMGKTAPQATGEEMAGFNMVGEPMSRGLAEATDWEQLTKGQPGMRPFWGEKNPIWLQFLLKVQDRVVASDNKVLMAMWSRWVRGIDKTPHNKVARFLSEMVDKMGFLKSSVPPYGDVVERLGKNRYQYQPILEPIINKAISPEDVVRYEQQQAKEALLQEAYNEYGYLAANFLLKDMEATVLDRPYAPRKRRGYPTNYGKGPRPPELKQVIGGISADYRKGKPGWLPGWRRASKVILHPKNDLSVMQSYPDLAAIYQAQLDTHGGRGGPITQAILWWEGLGASDVDARVEDLARAKGVNPRDAGFKITGDMRKEAILDLLREYDAQHKTAKGNGAFTAMLQVILREVAYAMKKDPGLYPEPVEAFRLVHGILNHEPGTKGPISGHVKDRATARQYPITQDALRDFLGGKKEAGPRTEKWLQGYSNLNLDTLKGTGRGKADALEGFHGVEPASLIPKDVLAMLERGTTLSEARRVKLAERKNRNRVQKPEEEVFLGDEPTDIQEPVVEEFPDELPEPDEADWFDENEDAVMEEFYGDEAGETDELPEDNRPGVGTNAPAETAENPELQAAVDGLKAAAARADNITHLSDDLLDALHEAHVVLDSWQDAKKPGDIAAAIKLIREATEDVLANLPKKAAPSKGNKGRGRESLSPDELEELGFDPDELED